MGIKFGEFLQNSPNSPNLIPAKINLIKVHFYKTYKDQKLHSSFLGKAASTHKIRRLLITCSHNFTWQIIDIVSPVLQGLLPAKLAFFKSVKGICELIR